MNKIHSTMLLAGATLILAACGNRGALQPAKGESLPPPVYGEAKAPSHRTRPCLSAAMNCSGGQRSGRMTNLIFPRPANPRPPV
mgnify:CR=1 FL=1